MTLAQAAAPAADAANAAAPIAIAQVIPLTGPTARRGDAWRNGAEMAVLEANGTPGPRIEVYTYDALSPAVGGRSSLLRALDTGVKAVLAMVPPTTIAAALPTAGERGIRLIAPGSAWPGSPSPWLTLASPTPRARMQTFLAWLRSSFGWRRFALLGIPSDPDRPNRDAFRSLAGPDLVAEAAVTPADTTSEIARLLRATPDAVFLDAPVATLPRLLTALRAQAPDLPILGDGALILPHTLEAAGPAAQHLIATTTGTPDIPALAPFATRYETLFKTPLTSFALEGYTAAALIRAASRRSPPPPLNGLHTDASETVLETTWGANGEPHQASFIARVGRVGEIEWLTLGQG